MDVELTEAPAAVAQKLLLVSANYRLLKAREEAPLLAEEHLAALRCSLPDDVLRSWKPFQKWGVTKENAADVARELRKLLEVQA